MSPADQPAPGIERTVLRSIEVLLDELGSPRRPVRPSSDLERELGLGSLERVELIGRIEAALAVRLPEGTLAEARTAGDLALAAAAARGQSTPGDGPAPAARAEDVPASRAASRALPDALATLVEVARFRAETTPDDEHLRFIGDEGTSRGLSYGQLWERSLRMAGALARGGVERNDRVALLLPTRLAFFSAFLGTLAAGGAAVPIYPPFRIDRLGAYLTREAGILRNAGAHIIVADRRLRQVARLLVDVVPSLREVVLVEDIDGETPSAPARLIAGDLALIQYTSGSTGDPKGVALTHGNIMANVRRIVADLRATPETTLVSWLPLYHDMGLIGAWFTPLLSGGRLGVMSPLHFLARPERWLRAISDLRGEIATAPNFAYELCINRIPDEALGGLDLSSWGAALNGAEPVRAATIERFCARFEPYGFRRDAVMPVYGLAECSVALTFTPYGRGAHVETIDRDALRAERRAVPTDAPGALTQVSCGRPLPDHEVRVVDRDAPDPLAPLPEREEGRVLFRGPSATSGYYGRPEATAEIRYGDWLDTGDLGYLAGGELYITGRIKDLIIKGGRNYHPQDIEQAAFGVPGIRKGNVVAFALSEGAAGGAGEAIVVVAETRLGPEHHEELIRLVTEAVSDAVGTPPDRVVPAAPGTIPKTSSGKLRRRETRERYLAGTLSASKRPAVVVYGGLALRYLASKARAGVRRTGRFLFGAWAILAFCLVGLPSAILIPLLCRDPRSARLWSRRALRTAFLLNGLRPRRLGGPLPSERAILVSNHASYLDGVVIAATMETLPLLTYMSQVDGWPVAGRLMRAAGYVSVGRTAGSGAVASFERLDEAAGAGALLHVFPESAITPATGLRPFRLGAFSLAVRHGLPIVPVAIRGTRKAMRDGTTMPRAFPIEVEVLDPVVPAAPEGEGDLAEAARLRDLVRARLAEAVGEPILDIRSAALPDDALDEPES